jgi:heptosyltransferase-1
VLLGGPADREAAARIAKGVPGIANLVGALKLDESVAAIADAALALSLASIAGMYRGARRSEPAN